MESIIGKFGTFVFCRGDGKTEVYDAFCIDENDLYFRIRLRDNRETDLLKTCVPKIEWKAPPYPWLPQAPKKEESESEGE